MALQLWKYSLQNQLMVNVMHGFNGLFGNSSPWVAMARNTGLDAVNKLSLVKDLIIRHASGLSGDLPRAALKLPIRIDTPASM